MYLTERTHTDLELTVQAIGQLQLAEVDTTRLMELIVANPTFRSDLAEIIHAYQVTPEQLPGELHPAGVDHLVEQIMNGWDRALNRETLEHIVRENLRQFLELLTYQQMDVLVRRFGLETGISVPAQELALELGLPTSTTISVTLAALHVLRRATTSILPPLGL